MDTKKLLEIGIAHMDESDYEHAYRCFQEAALKEEPKAVLYLGYMYLYGMYVKRDYEKAFRYFKTYFEMTGSLEPLPDLAWESDNVMGCAEGRNEYHDYIEFLIEKEDWRALILKGDEIQKGIVYEKDPKECMRCYEEAWGHGIKMGNECLGEIYYLGELVEADYDKARECFERYEGMASLLKPYYIAEMYRLGRGYEQDVQKAIEIYESIIETDDPWDHEDEYYKKAKKRLEELTGTMEGGEDGILD